MCVCSSADTGDQMTPFRRSCSNGVVETTWAETTKRKEPGRARLSCAAVGATFPLIAVLMARVARRVARPRRRSGPPTAVVVAAGLCFLRAVAFSYILPAFRQLSRGPSKLHIQHPPAKNTGYQSRRFVGVLFFLFAAPHSRNKGPAVKKRATKLASREEEDRCTWAMDVLKSNQEREMGWGV